MGKGTVQLTDGQEATHLEEIPREPPMEEQRCEPGLSPPSLASQEECTTTQVQEHLSSMQPEAKASSVEADSGISESGDMRSRVQT